MMMVVLLGVSSAALAEEDVCTAMVSALVPQAYELFDIGQSPSDIVPIYSKHFSKVEGTSSEQRVAMTQLMKHIVYMAWDYHRDGFSVSDATTVMLTEGCK